MSLINQMLQDLEKRQSKGETAIPASVQVKAVTKHRRTSFVLPILLLLVPVAGMLAWLLLRAPAPKTTVATPPVKTVSAPPAAEAPPVPVGQKPVPAEARPLETQAKSSPVQTSFPPPAQPQPGDLALNHPPELAMALKLSGMPENSESNKPASSNLPLALSATDSVKQKPAPVSAKGPAPDGAADTSTKTAFSSPTIAKQVREITPQQQAESEYRKALALIQQGRLQEAIGKLGLTLQLDSHHGAARQTLIGLLVEAGRYSEAERRLRDGLDIDLSQRELAMTLARLQVERGDVQAALATLERTLPYAAERADYQAFMAALLQRENRHKEAIEHYLLATRRAPQSGVWLMGLGISLQAENRLPEARQAFSQAEATNTLSPELLAFVEQRLTQLGSH